MLAPTPDLLTHRFTTGGRLLRQSEMTSVIVVVTDLVIHQASQVPFIQDNHIVEQIAARAKVSSEENDQEPQQTQHVTSFTFTCEKAKLGTQSIYLIRQ